MRRWINFSHMMFIGLILALVSSVISAQAVMLARIADNQYASMYTGPGFSYNVLRQLSEDNVLTLTGRNEDGSWVYAISANQIEGWVEAGKVVPQGDIFTLPVLPVTAAARGEILPGMLNLRSGPSPAFGVIAQLQMDVPLRLIGRNVNNTWVQVVVEGFGSGWVDANFIDSNTDLSNLPITSYIGSVPPMAVPMGVVVAQNLNVRHGAGTEYYAFTTVPQNENVWLIARTADSQWLLVQIPTGQVGWVSANFVQTNFLMANLPISE